MDAFQDDELALIQFHDPPASLPANAEVEPRQLDFAPGDQ